MTWPRSGAQLCCPAHAGHPFHPGPTLTAPQGPYTKARPRAAPPTRPVLPVWHPGREQSAGLEGPGALSDLPVSGWTTPDPLVVLQGLNCVKNQEVWHRSFEALVPSSPTGFSRTDGGSGLHAPGTSPSAPPSGLPLTGITQDISPAGLGSPVTPVYSLVPAAGPPPPFPLPLSFTFNCREAFLRRT